MCIHFFAKIKEYLWLFKVDNFFEKTGYVRLFKMQARVSNNYVLNNLKTLRKTIKSLVFVPRLFLF